MYYKAIPPRLSVLANDLDPESGALTLAATPSIDASKGTITTSSDKKTLNLTLNASFTGDISFSYLVADAQGNQTTGQATVTVKPCNRCQPSKIVRV
jgi:hypothetical protein